MRKLTKIEDVIVKKIIIVVVVMGILAASVLLIMSVIKSSENKKLNKEIVHKIEKIQQNEEATCQDFISELGNTTTEGLKAENKKTVLESRMSCYASERDFNKSIAAAEQLREVYRSESNTAEVERLDRAIEEMKIIQSREETGTGSANDEE